MRVTCSVNGEEHEADDVWEGESLLYVLRERMGLPGSKNACEQGECGSCSVFLDDVLVCACLVAAGQARAARSVRSRGWPVPSPTTCTRCSAHSSTPAPCSAGSARPGLVVATVDLLARDPDPSDAEIREALAGNVCRCTGYESIMAAVRLAAVERGRHRCEPARC